MFAPVHCYWKAGATSECCLLSECYNWIVNWFYLRSFIHTRILKVLSSVPQTEDPSRQSLRLSSFGKHIKTHKSFKHGNTFVNTGSFARTKITLVWGYLKNISKKARAIEFLSYFMLQVCFQFLIYSCIHTEETHGTFSCYFPNLSELFEIMSNECFREHNPVFT